MKSHILMAVVAILLSLLGLQTSTADEFKDDLAALQGKWKATLTTDEGTSTWKLEIKDNKSKLTIESREGATVFKGECDFKLEQTGPFKAFTYSNLEVLSGDNAGQKLLVDESRSSVYKLKDNVFTTCGGFSKGETGEPHFLRWTRD